MTETPAKPVKQTMPVVCPKCGVTRTDFFTSDDDQGYLQYGYRVCGKCWPTVTVDECDAHDKAHWAKKP